MRIFLRHKKIILLMALCGLILLPSAAHAAEGGVLGLAASYLGISATDSTGGVLLKLIQAALNLLQDLLVKAIVTLGDILNQVITLNANGGGDVIGASWRILRDLCNMAFIVVIIITSFGTVFNTFQIGFLKQYSIYNPKLISSFLIAAILMNFSLAIGQGIVALSDHVTDAMVGIIGKNVAGQVAQSLQVSQVVGSFDAPAADLSIPPPPDQGSGATTVDAAKRERNKAWENIFLGNYLHCITENGGIPAKDTCYHVALGYTARLPYPEVATTAQRAYSQAQGTPPPVEVTGGLWRFVGIGGDIALSQDVQTSGLAQTTERAAASIYSIFLLMVVGLSFLAADIFAFIRIPAIWIILVLSPLAWVGLLFENLGTWKEWWKQFMAWNIFSPLYLFVIYIGLYLINQQPNLLAQLGTNSTFSAHVGILLFYVMTGIIFIGGTAAVLRIAFASGTYAGGVFSSISGGLGISGKAGAVGAVYRGIGLEPRVSGAAKGLASVYERVPLVGPGALRRRREEVEAKYQARFGERGALEALERKRITEQANKNKERGVAMSDLKKDFDKGPVAGAKYFAAADSLLSEGKLNATEMLDYQKAAAKVSPSFSNAVREKVEKKLKDTSKEKQFKYKDTKEVLDALERYKPNPNNKNAAEEEANKKMYADILKKVEQTQPLIAAALAADGLYINPNGTRKGASEIIEGNFGALDNKDLLKLVDQKNLTPTTEKLLIERVKKLQPYLNLINSASPEQQAEIAHIVGLQEKIQREKQKKGKKRNP